MHPLVKEIADINKKHHTTDVKSGDTVRVHQKIKEGNKERIQVFEGLVIRTDRKKSHTSSITVRRVTGSIGVEKSYLLHSPLVVKVEVVKRSKVRRNYLTYMRARTGKAARLASVDFDKDSVNASPELSEKTTKEQNTAGSQDKEAPQDQKASDTADPSKPADTSQEEIKT